MCLLLTDTNECAQSPFSISELSDLHTMTTLVDIMTFQNESYWNSIKLLCKLLVGLPASFTFL